MSLWRRYGRRAGGRSQAGAVTAPVKLINFADDGTFTRASEASVFSGGALTCYADDVLRPGVSLAYTLEGAGDNLAKAGAVDFRASAGWVNNATTINVDATNAPDGTATADLIDSNTGGAAVSNNWGFTDSGAGDYAWSCFLKDGPNVNETAVQIDLGGAGAYANHPLWTRDIAIRPGSAGAAVARIYPHRNGGGDANDSVYAWGAQLEQNDFATSYMCDASGTRARDDLFIPLATFTTLDTKRYYLDIKPAFASHTGRVAYVYYSTSGSNYLRMNNNLIQLFTSGGAPQIAGTWAAGDTLRLEFEPANGLMRLYRNGVFQSQAFSDAWTATGTTFYIGRTNTGANPFYGEMSDIYEVPVADGDPLLDYTEANVTRASLAWWLDQRVGSDPYPYYEAASGEARIAADGAVYVEGSRTNLTNAQVGGTGWGTGGTAPTITTDDSEAPNGETEATKIVWPTTTSSRVFDSSVSFTAGTTYVYTVWAKGDVGGEELRMRINWQDGTNTETDHTLTTSWAKYEISGSTAAGATAEQVRVAPSNTNGETVYVWGAQIEAGDFVSQLIDADGPLTRAGDSVTFAGTPAIIREGVYEIDVWPGISSAELEAVGIDRQVLYQSGNARLSLALSGGKVKARISNTTAVVGNILTWDAWQKLTITIDWPNDLMTISGATTGDGSHDITAVPEWPAASITIGYGSLQSEIFGAISQPRRVIP